MFTATRLTATLAPLATHRAECQDDSVVTYLHHSEYVQYGCSGPCEGTRAHWLTLDGNPTWLCWGCMLEMDWVVTPL